MKKQSLLLISLILAALSFASAQTTDQIKTISGGVLNGKAQNLVKPEYPAAAKAVNAGGAVNVQVTIDENGDVISASAVSGHPLLRSAAVRAARESKFTPTRLSGELVKVTGVIVYNFNGAGDSEQTTGTKYTIAPNSGGSGLVIGSSEADGKSAISGGVVNGKAVNLAIPSYPAAAKAARASGAVNVQVTIDETGNVIAAEAVSGHPLLRAAAVRAARESTFMPTKLAGPPVKVTGIIVYNFTPDGFSAETFNWFKVGFDLSNAQYAPSLVFLNTEAIGKTFRADWTTEKDQLQRLAEIKQAETENAPRPIVTSERIISEETEKKSDGSIVKKVIAERAVKSDNQPTGEQIAISQSLTAALQGRLGNDEISLWQFNTGLSLSRALSKLRYTDERQSVLNALRRQIQSAPSGVPAEFVNNLQRILTLVEKQNPTPEERGQLSQSIINLFRN